PITGVRCRSKCPPAPVQHAPAAMVFDASRGKPRGGHGPCVRRKAPTRGGLGQRGPQGIEYFAFVGPTPTRNPLPMSSVHPATPACGHALPSYLDAGHLGPWGVYLQQVDRVTPYLGNLARWVETLKRP